MTRVVQVRDRTGSNFRVEVSDEAAAELRREGLRARRTEVLRLAGKLDPEPTDEAVRRRMRERGESYDLAACALYANWEERGERRERELAAGAAGEVTDEAVRERVARTGEPYADAARALAVELAGGGS